MRPLGLDQRDLLEALYQHEWWSTSIICRWDYGGFYNTLRHMKWLVKRGLVDTKWLGPAHFDGSHIAYVLSPAGKKYVEELQRARQVVHALKENR